MSPEEKSKPPVNRFDLILVFLRTFLIQAVWNFERNLNYGVAWVLTPVLRKVYNDEERPRALARHLEYFNTHPYMASFILGAVVKMEMDRYSESKAKQKQKEEEISALKVGMMGPVAAMGDNLFWATLRPFCGLLAVSLAFSSALPADKYRWLVPFLFLAVYNVAHLGIRLGGFVQGLRQGDQVVLSLRKYGFQEAVRGFKMASAVLLGALVVLVNAPAMGKGPALFLLQLGFFAAILGLYAFALRKKVGPGQMFYGVVLFALMLAYWPELSAATDAEQGAWFPFATGK